LQYYIAAAPVDPPNQDDYYTEGWAALRQCALDGQHILNCAADTRVPSAQGGPEEQEKAELQQ
jgi:predicted O-linked N-acetylglucosamine transferase (SPINDLY family)